MGQLLGAMIVLWIFFSIIKVGQFGGRVVNKVDKWSRD